MKASAKLERFDLLKLGMSDEDIAKTLGLSLGSWISWKSRNHADMSDFLNESDYNDHLRLVSYVSRRPQWERDIIKHFATHLEKAVDNYKGSDKITAENIGDFMSVYVKIFGRSSVLEEGG